MFSPSGKKFRSKPQLSRYLGNAVDLACFDFRTGRMMPGKLQKNKQRLRHEALSLAKVRVEVKKTRRINMGWLAERQTDSQTDRQPAGQTLTPSLLSGSGRETGPEHNSAHQTDGLHL